MFKKLKRKIKSIYNNIYNKKIFLKQHPEIFEFNKLVDIKENSILIIEANLYHAETLVGNCKYFLDLGYNVDIVITYKSIKEDPFCRFNNNSVRIFISDEYDLSKWAKNNFSNKYDFIFFNSYTCSCAIYIEKLFKKLPPSKYGILGVEHNILEQSRIKFQEIANKIEEKRLFILSNNINIPRINPHYFGDIKITTKNKNKIIFTNIGKMSPNMRNYKIIIKTIEELINDNVENFKIIFIGAGKLKIPKYLSKYIEIKGRINFPDMFDIIEKSDFLLCTMDPTDIRRQCYLKGQSSGNIQLSLGFKKPLIINEVFGRNYEFSDNNAIMYNENNLKNGILEAINISLEDYEKMQNSIDILANKIYNQSLNDLKNVINNLKN